MATHQPNQRPRGAQWAAALSLLLCLAILPADGAHGSALLPDISGPARELGTLGALAERCGMDDPGLVSRQIGIQMAAHLLSSSSPEQTRGAVEGFRASVSLARSEYDATDDVQKSRLCAFAWLGWRSARSASTMTTASPDMGEANDLAQSSGSVHGWLWRCQLRSQLDQPPGGEIARQASLSLALAALSSEGMDDLLAAHASWSKGFSESLGDESLLDVQCPSVARSLPRIALAFSRRSDLAPSLRRAKALRLELLGRSL